ncbi:unnamed protein product [Notodromas monacha]|uniref:PH domain-containing protein n=1 Tax=Notodromas monacha TaxID=399045 RepID=A0A7R9BKV3_9CRUS|nr:unnamed protein product [Notodromas monacha]CAG0917350.1 unnamed protein product [Notodromas monacha]
MLFIWLLRWGVSFLFLLLSELLWEGRWWESGVGLPGNRCGSNDNNDAYKEAQGNLLSSCALPLVLIQRGPLAGAAPAVTKSAPLGALCRVSSSSSCRLTQLRGSHGSLRPGILFRVRCGKCRDVGFVMKLGNPSFGSSSDIIGINADMSVRSSKSTKSSSHWWMHGSKVPKAPGTPTLLITSGNGSSGEGGSSNPSTPPVARSMTPSLVAAAGGTPSVMSSSSKMEYKAQRKTYRKEKKRLAGELTSALRDPSIIIMHDWLKVRGTLKGWTKLWCVLKPGHLLLYKSPKTKVEEPCNRQATLNRSRSGIRLRTRPRFGGVNGLGFRRKSSLLRAVMGSPASKK